MCTLYKKHVKCLQAAGYTLCEVYTLQTRSTISLQIVYLNVQNLQNKKEGTDRIVDLFSHLLKCSILNSRSLTPETLLILINVKFSNLEHKNQN